MIGGSRNSPGTARWRSARCVWFRSRDDRRRPSSAIRDWNLVDGLRRAQGERAVRDRRASAPECTSRAVRTRASTNRHELGAMCALGVTVDLGLRRCRPRPGPRSRRVRRAPDDQSARVRRRCIRVSSRPGGCNCSTIVNQRNSTRVRDLGAWNAVGTTKPVPGLINDQSERGRVYRTEEAGQVRQRGHSEQGERLAA